MTLLCESNLCVFLLGHASSSEQSNLANDCSEKWLTYVYSETRKSNEVWLRKNICIDIYCEKSWFKCLIFVLNEIVEWIYSQLKCHTKSINRSMKVGIMCYNMPMTREWMISGV